MVYPLFQRSGGQPKFSGHTTWSTADTKTVIAAPSDSSKRIVPVWAHMMIVGANNSAVELRGATSGNIIFGNDDGTYPAIVSGFVDFISFAWGLRLVGALDAGEALEMYIGTITTANSWSVCFGYYEI